MFDCSGEGPVPKLSYKSKRVGACKESENKTMRELCYATCASGKREAVEHMSLQRQIQESTPCADSGSPRGSCALFFPFSAPVPFFCVGLSFSFLLSSWLAVLTLLGGSLACCRGFMVMIFIVSVFLSTQRCVVDLFFLFAPISLARCLMCKCSHAFSCHTCAVRRQESVR